MTTTPTATISTDIAERYCLACNKSGHRTDECWSTHGINTPQARELFRLVRAAAPVAPEPAAAQEPVAQQLAPSGAVLTDAVIRDLYSKSMRELVAELETDTRVTRRSAPSGTLRKLSEDIHKFRFARAIAAHLAPQPLAEVSAAQAVPELLNELRSMGLTVAVHNDYRLNGKPHTFWLMVGPDGMSYKGEGMTDKEALTHVFLAFARPSHTTREA